MSLEIIDIEKKYNAEIALIILLLRNYFKTTDQNQVVEFIDERKNKINWSKLKSLAAYHRIRPLLFKELVKLECLDYELKKALKNDIRQFTIRNFQLVYEAQRVIHLFEKNGIKAIPYKGPFFSKEFFGDYASRESSDIDILIEWKDLKTCIAILEKEGYISVVDFIKFYGETTKVRENEYNMDFYENGHRIFHIELHWNIGNPHSHPLNCNSALLQIEKNDGKITNIQYSMSSAALLFSTLVHHSVKDTFGILRNVTDLAKAFVSLDEKNRAELFFYIENNSFESQAQMAIQLSNSLLNLSIPIGNCNFKMNTHLFTHHLLDSKYQKSPMKHLFYPYIRKIILEKSWKNKMYIFIYMIKLLFYPNYEDYQWISLPRGLKWAYFLLKPIRFIKDHSFDAQKK